MTIPANIIANADDFGFSHSINEAILYCFEQKYINSTSLMVNTDFFGEAVELIHQNACIQNTGVHINLAEGKPVTNFIRPGFLDENGNWDFKKINQKFNLFASDTKSAFSKEIYGQIDKALSNKLLINHIDSHCHLHTLPCFYKLFIEAAKHYKLKIRLAQTYNENNYLKFYMRKYINNTFKAANCNYSEYFETVNQFLKNIRVGIDNKTIEIMLHPCFDVKGKLKDHYDENSMEDWLIFLQSKK